MSHPTEAWKFKAWSEAMLRGARVGTPEYKGKSLGTSKISMKPRRRRRRKRRKNAKKE